ncbi:MAG TPA: hypothetical protein VGG62_16080, partial [Terracidiphilus sp.]
FASGDFGHAVLYEDFTPETVAVRAWWCCTLHGLRAFPDVHDSVFRQQRDNIFYDLPLDGKWKSQTAIIEAQSRLATDGKVRLVVENMAGSHSLTIRKPDWADAVVVTTNGKHEPGLTAPLIKTGDEIVVKYTMNVRLATAERTQTRPDRKALSFGPWLLGASSHDQAEYFNELYPDNQIAMESGRMPYPGGALPFAVPIAATPASCIPAEFPGQPVKVELRAVAEQTGYEPARWQTAFLVRAKS